jgi:hypothetical protein
VVEQIAYIPLSITLKALHFDTHTLSPLYSGEITIAKENQMSLLVKYTNFIVVIILMDHTDGNTIKEYWSKNYLDCSSVPRRNHYRTEALQILSSF